jgi:hypothetical protein
MKKGIIVALLLVALSVSAFGQENPPPQAAIHVNLGTTILGAIAGGFGIGGGFELAIGSSLGFRTNIDFVTADVIGEQFTYFFINPSLRFYPGARAVEGFYLGAGLGVFILDYNSENFTLPIVEAEIGFTGNIGGFMLEPFLGYLLAINNTSDYPIGIKFGLNIGALF